MYSFGMESKTIKFLLDASRVLKRNDDTVEMSNIISQLSQRYLEIAPHVPKSERLLPSDVCKCCGNQWIDGHFKLSFIGHKLQMRKRKSKYEQKSKLSPPQRNFLSFFKTRKDNILVKKCLICNAVNKFGMNNPFLKLEQENLNSSSTLQCVKNANSVKKKKKRKNKNESFAGLSAAAVWQARHSLKIADQNESTSNATKLSSDVSIVSRNKELLSNNVNLGKSISLVTVPEIVSSNNCQDDFHLKNFISKNHKLINTNQLNIGLKKKSKFKKKKKSFVSKV